MRKLFMAITIPVLFVLGTPALIATIMYDGSGDTHMPTYLYTEDADAKAMLFEELSASIDEVETGTTSDMEFNLHQDILNTAIFQGIREQNPDYMPTDDCTTDDCNYVFAESLPVEGYDISLRLVGAWVEFQEDTFITNVFLEVSLNDGFTYKTIFQTYFKFRDLDDKYELEFDKIQLGNLPIPKAMISSILNTVDSQVDQIDLEEQAAGIPIGTFDVDNIQYTLMKDEILAQLDEQSEGEDNPGADIAQEVLGIVYDNNLIEFKLNEEEFVLTAGVSKFRSEDVDDIPPYLYDMHFKTEVDGQIVVGEFNPDAFDVEGYLVDKFTEFVFNGALLGDTDFKIKERTFNKLIYAGAEGFSDTRSSYEYTNDLGEVKTIEFGLKAIWFELAPDDIYVNVLFRIAGIESLLQIKAVNQSTSDLELVFEFTEITFGKDEGETDGEYLSILDLDVFKQLFASIGDVEFGEFDENGVLTISAARLQNLMQDGTNEGAVNVESIAVIQDAIVLRITPADEQLAAALESFQTEINAIFEDPALLTNLDDVLDITTEGPEQDVYQGVVALQEQLTGENPDPEVIAETMTDMFEDFETLDPETQEAFLDTFTEMVDPETYSQYADLFEQQTGQTSE